MVDEARTHTNRGRINRASLEGILSLAQNLHSSITLIGVVPEIARAAQAHSSALMAKEVAALVGGLSTALSLDSGALDKEIR